MKSKQPIRPKVVQGFDQETGLPDAKQAQQQVAAVVGTPRNSFTAADMTPPPPRQPGLTAKGRVKFTTMLKPDLREKLEGIAANRAISVADVLETILTDYLNGLR